MFLDDAFFPKAVARGNPYFFWVRNSVSVARLSRYSSPEWVLQFFRVRSQGTLCKVACWISTYTDPEDDKMTDSTLPIGSTSKTCDPRKDGSFWQRKDGSQDWSHSFSSTGQWKPKLRHEKSFSSAAGDASDASNAVHRLGSIHETDGDAVKAPSDRTNQWW